MNNRYKIQMNNRQIYYKINISLKTLDDYYLLEYVENELMKELMKNKNNYKFTKPIRPSKFVYNQLTKQQKTVYNALTDVDECECPICYDKLNNYNTIRTKCNHSFCKECFSKLITHSDKCPYCRTQMRTYEEMFVTPVVIGLCFKYISYDSAKDCVMLYYKLLLLSFVIEIVLLWYCGL